jgi:hypothetical protein
LLYLGDDFSLYATCGCFVLVWFSPYCCLYARMLLCVCSSLLFSRTGILIGVISFSILSSFSLYRPGWDLWRETVEVTHSDFGCVVVNSVHIDSSLISSFIWEALFENCDLSGGPLSFDYWAPSYQELFMYWFPEILCLSLYHLVPSHQGLFMC